MRKPRGVTFDLGGTILRLDSADAFEGNHKLLEFAVNNTDITVDDIQSMVDEMGDSIFNTANESNIQIRIQDFYRLMFETLGLSFRIDYPEMERQFWNAAMKYSPNDGIYDVLDILDEFGIRTGILSNSFFTGGVMLEELEKHNMANRFSFLISTADYGVRKPDKHIFDVAIKKIGLEPEDIWFAGDKVEYDLQGAINAGLFPVFYNWRNETIKLDRDYLEVKDWYEFRDRMELLYKD